MKRHGCRRNPKPVVSLSSAWRAASLCLAIVGSSARSLSAQANTPANTSQRIQQLTDAMTQAQQTIQETQQQLNEMRKELTDLQQQLKERSATVPSLPAANAAQTTSPSSAQTTATADTQDIRERQDMQQTEIATQEQTKVESESKYPVKVTGMLLLNGFVNTSAVDTPSVPALAVGGPGSTGATVQQTVLGLDARGPHLFGAQSYADVRVDFFGNPQTNNAAATYSGYYGGNSALLRLRTAHAGLQWQHTQAYFALDRPIFSPDSPTSLTAVAEPPLAWSGNLWTWNPQLGITHDVTITGSKGLRLQAALIDVGDAPVLPAAASSTGVTPPSTAEQSRWPGIEGRIALFSPKDADQGNHLGVGGYFAPHTNSYDKQYDSWASTLDTRLHLPSQFQLTASFYRGKGLGGLGGGAYKDFVYRSDSSRSYFRELDDVGGWAQLQRKLNERIQFNAAIGFDNVFAYQLRPYATTDGNVYQNLARNRTFTGNAIFSPSAYLLFSVEYRHMDSTPVTGSTNRANVFGVAAAYKF